jgi:hypothetical protein
VIMLEEPPVTITAEIVDETWQWLVSDRGWPQSAGRIKSSMWWFAYCPVGEHA